MLVYILESDEYVVPAWGKIIAKEGITTGMCPIPPKHKEHPVDIITANSTFARSAYGCFGLRYGVGI